MIHIPENNETKSILIAVIPFILFLITFFAFVFLSEYFQLHNLQDTIKFYGSNPLSDHIEHLYLTTAITVVLVLMILSVTVSIYIIKRWINQACICSKVIIMSVGVMSFAAVLIALLISNPALNKALGFELLKLCDSIENGVNCSEVLHYLLIATAIFWGFAVSATCSLLYINKSNVTADTLADRIRDYKFLLYIVAGVYSIGILTLFLLYHSPASNNIVIDTSLLRTIEIIPSISAANSAKAITKYWAITFSIYIIVLFLPVAILHRGWAKELANPKGQTKTMKERNEWLENNGLSVSIKDIFTQVIAYISPILTGLLGSLSNFIK